jgi:hypothetical protein
LLPALRRRLLKILPPVGRPRRLLGARRNLLRGLPWSLLPALRRRLLGIVLPVGRPRRLLGARRNVLRGLPCSLLPAGRRCMLSGWRRMLPGRRCTLRGVLPGGRCTLRGVLPGRPGMLSGLRGLLVGMAGRGAETGRRSRWPRAHRADGGRLLRRGTA